MVQCGNDEEIEVTREIWPNIRYTLNKNTRNLEEEELGSFVQFPIRLAWAITIHKSQGLTFEKAIIDAEAAFTPGQVYVALSRCTCLTGMVLQTKVRPASLYSDNRIVAFSQNQPGLSAIETELATAKRNYELTVLNSLFEFGVTVENCRLLIAYVTEHNSSFNDGATDWLTGLKEKVAGMQEVGTKFQAQLKSLFLMVPVDESKLTERIKAAGAFFNEKLQDAITYLQSSVASTDSRLHAKEYNDNLKEVFTLLAAKQYLIQGFNNGFSIELYQQRKRSFRVPVFSVNAYATASKDRPDLPHPSLYMQLKNLRDSICSKANTPIYLVAGSNTLAEISRYLPQTLEELRNISGFGEAKIEKYGQPFLDIIVRYSMTKGLGSAMNEKKPKENKRKAKAESKSKVDTKAESYKLFGDGKSVEEIASFRRLAVQTIEGHLAHYVQQGAIQIHELVSREKLVIIEPVLKQMEGASLTSIREKLGSNIGFGEIKLAMAWKEFQDSKEEQ